MEEEGRHSGYSELGRDERDPPVLAVPGASPILGFQAVCLPDLGGLGL